MNSLRALAAQPFHPGELWELNQLYFGATSVGKSADGGNSGSSDSGESSTEEESRRLGQKSDSRGMSPRTKIRRYISRIEAYPSVMAHLAKLHERNDDISILAVLRKLKFLEMSREEGSLDEDLDIGELLMYIH